MCRVTCSGWLNRVVRRLEMTFKKSFPLPPEADVVVPQSPAALGGPFTAGRAAIVSERRGRGVCCIRDLADPVDWIKDCDNCYFQIQADGSRKVIRKATDEDIHKFRVPSWIQSPEVPICCGKEMIFVGQINDDRICTEPPADATVWWHDAASFYVFTCPYCLECAAVGQQY